MSKKYVIVCPTHKRALSKIEINNLRITEKVNSCVDRYFLLPKGTPTDFYSTTFPSWAIIFVDGKYLSSNLSYNKFLLSHKFYELFICYKFLIVCQADAIILKNISYLPVQYDYIGAPWKNSCKFLTVSLYVGNGGLSLRRTLKFYYLTRVLFFIKFFNGNEDVLFAFIGFLKLLKVPKSEIAKNYFVETFADKVNNYSDYVGYHALNIFNPNLEMKIHNDFLNKKNNEQF